ncbi:MAG TPA: hypothetical protein VHN80_20645, partial [Kineosporiaceae bacterium]|nr:hypothetical protein [Kineosporiaceae bacterium]
MEVHGGSLRGRPYPAITASVLLLTILLDSSVALVLSALLGVLAAAVTGLAELGAYTFLSGLAGLVVVRRGERLGHFVQAAFAMAIVNVHCATVHQLLRWLRPENAEWRAVASVDSDGRGGDMGSGRRFSAVLAALSLLMVVIGSAAPVGVAAKGSGPSMVGRAASYHLSRPAREVAQSQPAQSQSRPAPARRNPLADEPDQGSRGTRDRGPVPADPLSGRTGAKSVAPPPFLSFNGTGNPTACAGCLPPDTVGDVGPSHYIQMVNSTKVAIYNKTGTPLAVPFDLGLLWPVSDLCSANDGDPNVLYDSRADRWMLSQFVANQGQALCFAVSTTSDPTGTYNLFRFTTSATAGDFPDYFKVGIGPDAYFVGTNEFLGSGYSAYAFDRTKMLVGDPTAGFIKFNQPGAAGTTNFLMPADLDGPNAFLGTAGYFYT